MKRAASALLAATAALGMTGQAVAQDAYVLPAPPPPVVSHPGGSYAGGYSVQTPMAQPVPMPMHGVGPAPYPVPLPGPAYGAHGYGGPAPYPAQGEHWDHYGQRGLPPSYSIGYTREERDGWLKNCRLAYEGAIKKDTAILGGIAMGIGGGFLGYEATKGSDLRRIGGTLVGAGVGGLVGLALGALIGGAFEKKKKHECDRYLERYEGAGRLPGPPAGFDYGWRQNGGFSYGYGAYGYHTIMVPVQVGGGYTYSAPIRTEHKYVTEEVIEEVVTRPARRVVHKAPATKTKYVPEKRVRYTK
ncbi:hypothetical protein [Tsuneonella sp. HG222]